MALDQRGDILSHFFGSADVDATHYGARAELELQGGHLLFFISYLATQPSWPET
jgi:hypothetical protein